ncbi:elongation factor 4 [Candidatus Uhrbacteria bacterium CG_4_10_14_0_8_um_filter_58_22]|uniref:Elongation factor 4 n=1 Tax=Candidatus Uhrbacteria bacterium CG_4_10_14_0_8_um_filter_58_22 TaxID=1975029 RepID=A0A2M7QBD8_9BACT|nr:MAG: elongation factor 4 [Parcubacteria group bacterium CG1_02_58_44]PIY62930.1 MAG: elongation factor 4 [Candidatus Uhrbacteria bacterium CG_4_10_14_0_8_um_filter_58_22]
MNSNIRNFCIIAHIDHGKSTLADRFLEYTGTVSKREMKSQILDQMDLERERGITIKLQPVRMNYRADDGEEYVLNLIDTPGHVDFTYEVSRSLAAVEGAVLLVDATQGVQAQTLANLYLALDENLTVIPVINKIDLPNARTDVVRDEIVNLLGCRPEEVLTASGKTGDGVREVLEAVVAKVPPPEGDTSAPLRALIFDSIYDSYKGVVAYVRVIDGAVRHGDRFRMVATQAGGEALEVGYFRPKMVRAESIETGETGYLVTGFKDIEQCRVGDTVTVDDFRERGVVSLAGYREVRPMVFAGIFPKEGNDYERLREAMHKLKLNDASLAFDPEHSAALGFGFRCGFLGMLHLEIVQERLRREHGMEIVVTLPSVAYEVSQTDGRLLVAKSPVELPDPSRISGIAEPWVKVDIVSPKDYLGAVMALAQEKRGVYTNTEYLMSGSSDASARAIIHYDLPLASILVDFYDKLKSASSGYASLSYELSGYRPADVVRLDILVNGDPAEALSMIVYRDAAQREGRRVTERLKETLPRQQFEIRIQASVGSKVVASSRIAPYRKDVTVGLYGGDVSRKQKLLEKQKKGKKRMGKGGRVDIPPEAYLAVLKR